MQNLAWYIYTLLKLKYAIYQNIKYELLCKIYVDEHIKNDDIWIPS